MRLFFRFAIFLVALNPSIKNAFAQSFSDAALREWTSELIQKHFPDLEDASISIRNFESQDYFFQTDLNALRLFGSKQKRKYWIEYNQKLLTQPPSRLAIRSILVHELLHIRDYHQRSAFELLFWLARYSLVRIDIEKHTDLETLRLGYSLGLMEYRYWLYSQLTDSEIRKKKKIYLEPDEIQKWRNENPQIADLP